MRIYVKFYHDHSPNMARHVTLATNFEDFYFSPNFTLNFRKVTKFEGNWLKNKTLQAKNKTRGAKHPPPVLLGLKKTDRKWGNRFNLKVRNQSLLFSTEL